MISRNPDNEQIIGNHVKSTDTGRPQAYKNTDSVRCFYMAERGGFEPPIPFQVYMISSHARSTSSATSPGKTSKIGDLLGLREKICSS